MLMHADPSGQERAAAEAEAATTAAAAEAATRESEVAAAAAMHKAATAALAKAEATKTKERAEERAELKESADLKCGTRHFRKRLISEVADAEGGLSGLGAKTGQNLKVDEYVRQLKSMRAKLAADAKAKQERASRVPVNAWVYTEGTNLFLGPAAQAPTTTLPSAPFVGAVELSRRSAREAAKNPAYVRQWLS